MTDDLRLVCAVLLLAAGTLALRLAGPQLRTRVALTPGLQALIARSVAVLFLAAAATTATLRLLGAS